MTILTLFLSPPSLPTFPPKLPKPTPLNNLTPSPLPHLQSTPASPSIPTISRRSFALLLSTIALFPWLSSSPAFAFDFGISGPKDWLKEQKKKSVKYLLAPIDASREILTYAQQLLLSKDSKLEEKDMEEFRGMVMSAARDCVEEDRNSLVAFQAKTGVEVCTFKLLVSNASSLLDDKDPAKLAAEAKLNDLIRSFTFLNGFVNEADIALVTDRQKVEDALTDTLSSLVKFEQGIKGCIEA